YVDDGTKKKATEQMALADAQRKGMTGDMKSQYTAAVADYKAGNFGSAKAKFETLVAQGYKPAMFQRSPDDYLKDIAKRMPPPEQPGRQTEIALPSDVQLQPGVAPPPPAPAPGVAPAPAPAPGPVAQVPPAPAPTVPPAPAPAPAP